MRHAFRRSEVEGIFRTVAEGRENLVAGEARARQAQRWSPPMDAVLFIEDMFYLPSEMTDRAGQYKLNGLQRAIVRRLQEDWVEIFAIQKPPRSGISTLAAALLLYYAIHEGVDVLFTERADDEAKTFFKKFLYPLMMSPKIKPFRRELGRGDRQDTWANTITTLGSTIHLRSVADDGFARQIKAKFMVPDESSSPSYMATGNKSEGGKIGLLMRRAQQFFDYKMLVPSTPTEEQFCNVSRLYKNSDQAVYDVPCPLCGVMQPFLPNFDATGPGMRFRCDPVTGEFLTYSADGFTMPDVWYECASCNGRIRETSKEEMIEHGALRSQVIDTHGRPMPKRPGVSGLYFWNAYSMDPQATWPNICRRYLISKADPGERQSFKNHDLALVWERAQHRVVPVGDVQARAEAYDAPCPAGVRLITWGNDNQQGTDDESKVARGEVVVVGWGYGEESWILGHFVVEAKPFSDRWQEEIYRIHDLAWRKADGTVLKALGGGVDVGYDFDHGLEFCHKQASRRRRIRALKGMNTRLKNPTVVHSEGKSKKNPLWTFQNVYKQGPTSILMERLRLDVAGPGRVHTPISLPPEFYESLTSVKRVVDKKNNLDYYDKGEDSEVYDCYVYAYARMRALIQTHKQLRPLILIPRASSVDSESGSATPYDGEDRSLNSEVSVAARAAEGTVRVDKPMPVTPSSLQPPKPKAGPEVWSGMQGTRPPAKPGAGRSWGKVGNGRGSLVTW